MPRRKQGLRSFHHKSRNGCSNCKRRRVKCNMHAPACANCVRRNEICEYQMLDQDFTPHWNFEIPVRGNPPSEPARSATIADLGQNSTPWNSHPIQSQLTRLANPTSGTLESYLTQLNPFRASLLLAMKGSFFNDSEKALWLPAIEKAGARHTYVQHAFFSVYALLFELNNPAQKMIVTSYQHHLTASSLFRLNSPDIVEDNWIAVVAFGVMMVIFELAVQQTCPESDFDILRSLLVLRNFLTINNAIGPYLHKSKMWPLIQNRNATFTPPSDNQLQASFRKMSNIIAYLLDTGAPHAETNRQAFWELREWSFGCNNYPRNWRHYCEWPASVSDDFIHLISEEEDVALLIAIHWCSVLIQSPTRWYLTKWAQRAVLHLMSKLKGDWSDFLAWPLSVAQDNGGTLAPPILTPVIPYGEQAKSFNDAHIDPLLL